MKSGHGKPNSKTPASRKVFTHLGLVCAATIIALAVYYRLHLHGSPKDRHLSQERVVRKEIVEKTGSTTAPGADLDNPIRQDLPGQVRRKAASFPPQATEPSGRLNNSPDRTAEPSAKTSAGGIEPFQELEVYSENPEYSDAQPPTLMSVAFDPQKAPPGANVVVYVHAADNLSGTHAVSGKAKSPSGTAVVGFHCQKSEDEGGPWVGVIELPDGAETGTWIITSLRLTDQVQNAKTYTQQDAMLRTAAFEVIGSGSDNTPPTIVDVTIDPAEIRGGEKIHLIVRAEDDQSGVAAVRGALLSPSKNARMSISCGNTEEQNVFAGDAVFPKNAESGQWILEYLQTEDVAKNTKVYYRNNDPELFAQATVRVYGENSDAYPPTLDNLTIVPAVVSYGDYVEIIVSGSDDVSGINIVFGRLRSPSAKAHIAFTCTYHGQTDTYRTQVTIQNNSEVGVWTVEHITMKDEARNQVTYGLNDELVKAASFEVIGES